MYLFYGFFFVCVCVCLYMSKKIFSCVLHTTNILTYFEHSSFYKKTNIQSIKRKCILAWVS
jgi:hypothetical protein